MVPSLPSWDFVTNSVKVKQLRGQWLIMMGDFMLPMFRSQKKKKKKYCASNDLWNIALFGVRGSNQP